jgi:hypothetical protein
MHPYGISRTRCIDSCLYGGVILSAAVVHSDNGCIGRPVRTQGFKEWNIDYCQDIAQNEKVDHDYCHSSAVCHIFIPPSNFLRFIDMIYVKTQMYLQDLL